jgi:hypothetical protein
MMTEQGIDSKMRNDLEQSRPLAIFQHHVAAVAAEVIPLLSDSEATEHGFQIPQRTAAPWTHKNRGRRRRRRRAKRLGQ